MTRLCGALLTLILLTAAIACGEGGDDSSTGPATPTPRLSPTEEQTEVPTRTAVGTPTSTGYDQVVIVGETQTRDGLDLTLDRVAIGSPSNVLTSEQLDYFDSTYPGTQSVVVVQFIVSNPTKETASLPIYTSTTSLVNDEQVNLDATVSDVEVEILAGATIEMRAAFPVTRYSPSEIQNVRFVLVKRLSFDEPASATTYDFTVPIP